VVCIPSVVVYLPNWLYDEISRIAREQNTTISKTIRQMLVKSLEGGKTEEREVLGISKTVSGIPQRKVVGSSESIVRPPKTEEVPPEEVLSTEEEGGRFERVEDEVVEEFLEGRGEPTIGDAIVKILYERAREPKELMRKLIDMGYPPEECEKVLEELVKRGAIEVCEVQIGKYGKKTLLRLKGGKRGEGREGD